MLRLIVIVSVFLSVQCWLNDLSGHERVYYTKEFIEAEGYPAETHHVVNNDGYILELHRIPYGRESQGQKNRPVVFLMHGFLGASNQYIFLGAEKSIAYNLADAGFDVWMGNARGTRNSRRHVSLDPDRNKALFFDFTFEEIALDDLPTMIDYALETSGQEKLHYLGHSQGGTVFLILSSMKPEYQSKIASAHLLAPVGYQNNFPNSQLRNLSSNTNTLYNLLRFMGNVEVFPPGSDEMFGRSSLVSRGTLTNFVNIDTSSGLVAGASLKQVAHFGQNVRDKNFRRWDHGSASNMMKYGMESPPSYDLTKIDIDVTLHYSLNDTLLSEYDALAMAKDIPRGQSHKISRETFTHMDYVISGDVKELVTDYVIAAMKKY